MVMLVVLLVGGHEVISGRISTGQLFQFIAYLGMMLFPLEILGWTLATMPRAYAAADRIEEIFATAPEADVGLAPPLRGHLVVRNLTFTYPGASRPALQDVSFDLPPGGKLGLVGTVGAGKSTLLALCLRFYDPPPGTVFVDGHDVLQLQPSALRAVFAFAPQEPFLFSDTVAANVAFARDDLPAIDLAAAVEHSALDQDVGQLVAGLATVVGERGVTLSGGQKQRVSLARALASDRTALLLDDTLSAVDPRTERRILRGLQAARAGRTMLVATHRLSVVVDADLVLVLDDGCVRERGNHKELMRRNGIYAAAFRRQDEAAALERPETDDTEPDDAEAAP
jgi:ATP-binding cassette subfamily B protein